MNIADCRTIQHSLEIVRKIQDRYRQPDALVLQAQIPAGFYIKTTLS